MYRYKISLSTGRDVAAFVSMAVHIKEPVRLNNGENLTINAKSLLSVIMALTWDSIYCCCEKDISEQIQRFICEEAVSSEA